ncbi:MAG: hypothetical protein HKM95_05350 [Inquilinus sp.]|nr:hypothetical protein [Inquilinus sp.]
MSSTRSPSKKAPATSAATGAATLVLCGHGTRGRGGVLERHAAAIRARTLFADVRVCSLYGAPALATVLDQISAPQVQVVPWLMCAGYTMDRLSETVDAHPAADRIVLSEPIGVLPGIADLTSNIAAAACRRRHWTPEETGLLLIAHGSGRNPISAETTRWHAARIAATGRFGAIATAFLDEPPSPAEALAGLDTPNCVAVGLFAERSLHGEEDVPRLLGTDRVVDYTGPIGTAPDLVDISGAQARATRRRRAPDAA